MKFHINDEEQLTTDPFDFIYTEVESFRLRIVPNISLERPGNNVYKSISLGWNGKNSTALRQLSKPPVEL